MNKHIVLIGMPGAGKSTVGARLAARLGRPLLDTDAMVEVAAGCPIPTLFAREGEAHFRDLESEMARRAAAAPPAVIATGGGMVLRPENMAVLGGVGYLVFLHRPVADIARQRLRGRPLLDGSTQRLEKLYTERIELYRKYAEYTVSGVHSPAEAVDDILTWLEGKVEL